MTRKKGGEQARLDLARSLNSWEIQKEHVFLDGFVALAQAYAQFFKNGSGVMKGMDSFVDDMQQSCQQAISREVYTPALLPTISLHRIVASHRNPCATSCVFHVLREYILDKHV